MVKKTTTNLFIEKMERVCEFCKAYRAVVYCIADAANLCLTCDAKVHSANALSGRHLRTLLCDSCKNRPCVVRCSGHKMFLCNECNHKLHGGSVSSFEHRRRDVSCYTGCPPAKDFAVMWGFRVMDDDDASLEKSFGMVKHKGQSEMSKVQREAGFILEQILELEKIQLREEKSGLSSIEQADPSPLELPKQSEEDRLIDLSQTGKELVVDFSHLSSSSTLGDSFWECKSSNQLWYQNLQDIGVCEGTVCDDDDFHIPDIDLTFKNFEELFGADSDPNNVFVGTSARKSREMKTFTSPFNNSIFAPKPASSSTLSFSRSNGGGSSDPRNNSEEVISFCSPLSNNARQNAITRLKEKKRARIEEKKA